MRSNTANNGDLDMMRHEHKFTHIAERYKYIDTSSWEVANQVDLNPEELTVTFSAALEKDQQAQLDIAILAFHYIWNQQNIQLAQQMLKLLLTAGEGILHPFYYFLESKAYHFNRDYDLSLALLGEAEESLQSHINGNADYRQLLTCIGSLNHADPVGREYTVMQAIISNDKGNNYHAMGQYDLAVDAFMYALKLQTETYTTMCHANIAYTRRCMAKSLEEQGMHQQALEQYNLANAIAETIYNDECHPEAIAIKKLADSPSLRDF